MNKICSLTILMVVVLLFVYALAISAVADDDHEDRYRDKPGSHERYEKGEHREHGLNPVDFPAYLETCGACHFAYPPELLPAVSWEKILSGLGGHFGEAVALEEDTRQAVGEYLRSHSAETSSAKIAVKVMRSLEGQIPMRITDVFYIQKKHHGIPADVFKRKPVGSFSNCTACHTTAAGGVYDEDEVRIPR